jgi:hypothetical protein
MARLVAADESNTHLGRAKGWLKDDDPFFDAIEQIIQDRTTHEPRVFKGNFTE